MQVLFTEIDAAGIEKPAVLAATRADEADPGAVRRLALACPELEVIGVSVLDEASLDVFRAAAWRLTGQRVGRDHAVQDGDVVEILR